MQDVVNAPRFSAGKLLLGLAQRFHVPRQPFFCHWRDHDSTSLPAHTQLEQFWRFSALRMAEMLGFAMAWSKA
jgi:hypothetical protein